MKSFDLEAKDSGPSFQYNGKAWKSRRMTAEEYYDFQTLHHQGARRARTNGTRALFRLMIEYLVGTDAALAAGVYREAKIPEDRFAGLVEGSLEDRTAMAMALLADQPNMADEMVDWIVESQLKDPGDVDPLDGQRDTEGGGDS